MGWYEFAHLDVIFEEMDGPIRQNVLIEMKLFHEGAVVEVVNGPEKKGKELDFLFLDAALF